MQRLPDRLGQERHWSVSYNNPYSIYNLYGMYNLYSIYIHTVYTVYIPQIIYTVYATQNFVFTPISSFKGSWIQAASCLWPVNDFFPKFLHSGGAYVVYTALVNSVYTKLVYTLYTVYTKMVYRIPLHYA
jgi:hypothetical protein